MSLSEVLVLSWLLGLETLAQYAMSSCASAIPMLAKSVVGWL